MKGLSEKRRKNGPTHVENILKFFRESFLKNENWTFFVQLRKVKIFYS